MSLRKKTYSKTGQVVATENEQTLSVAQEERRQMAREFFEQRIKRNIPRFAVETLQRAGRPPGVDLGDSEFDVYRSGFVQTNARADAYTTVLDCNKDVSADDEEPPVANLAPTDITIDDAAVDEAEDGAIVGTLTVTDPDDSTGFAWFVDNTTSPGNKFTIDNVSGVTARLRLKPGMQVAESDSPITLNLRVRDPHAAEYTENLDVTVDANTPVNNAPTDISLTGTDVQRDSPGFVVGTLSTTDADVGDEHTYTITSNPGDQWEIGGTAAPYTLKLKDTETVSAAPAVSRTVRFDSSAAIAQYLTLGATLSGLADGTAWTFAFVIEFMDDASASGSGQFIFATNNSRIRCSRRTDGKLEVRTTGTTGIDQAKLVSLLPFTADGIMHTVVGSVNGATGVAQLYVDRQSNLDLTESFANNVTYDLATGNNFSVAGRTDGGLLLNARVNDIAFHDVHVDLSDVANLNKFFTTANVVADWTSTEPFGGGVTPELWLHIGAAEAVSDFAANDGADSGTFTINGTPTTSDLPAGSASVAVEITTRDRAGAEHPETFNINVVDRVELPLEGTLLTRSNYETLGVRWAITGQGSGVRAFVRFRVLGSGSAFTQTLDLPYVPHLNTYIGKIFKVSADHVTLLTPDTDYECEFFLNSVSKGVTTITTRVDPDDLPIAETRTIDTAAMAGQVINIRNVFGLPTGYIKYTAAVPATAHDAQNIALNNMVVENCQYVIIDDFILRNARQGAMFLRGPINDLVLQNLDVQNWGEVSPFDPTGTFAHQQNGITGQQGGAEALVRITIQDCTVANPRWPTNSWTEDNGRGVAPSGAGWHPYGPQAIVLTNSGAGTVIRRCILGTTTTWQSGGKYMNDIITGTENGLGADTDVSNNTIAGCWDNAIQVDGNGENFAMWGNTFDRVMNAISLVPMRIGPVYYFLNRLERTEWDKGSGYFSNTSLLGFDNGTSHFKYRSNPANSGSPTLGRFFVLHNTEYKREDGMGGVRDTFVADRLADIYCRNNIFRATDYVFRNNGPAGTLPGFDADYDLCQAGIAVFLNSSGEANGILGEATYDPASSINLDTGTGGHNDGFALPNFAYTGGADRGKADVA